VDLLSCLANSPAQSVLAQGMDNCGRYQDDNVSITLRFGDGSMGTVIYTANGDGRLAKERLEVFGEGGVGVLDDFQVLELYKGRRRRVIKLRKQDKGHRETVRRFIEAVRTGAELPITFAAALESTAATLAAREALHLGAPLRRGWPRWATRALFNNVDLAA
jgi:polar amino acid transport system substrate-binding protein